MSPRRSRQTWAMVRTLEALALRGCRVTAIEVSPAWCTIEGTDRGGHRFKSIVDYRLPWLREVRR